MTEPSYADAGQRYRLDALVATGGMGEVWRGFDTSLDRVVAVKILKPQWSDDLTYRRRFTYEARHAAALRHPDIAAIYDVGETPEARPFLVMEFIDGRPLSQFLGRPLDPAVVAGLLASAADALGAAHAAGIIHRDVKPANLMVTTDRRVKVTDFGIARATDGVALTTAGEVLGTPSYLSPEQARGDRATPASDVYSLGVVAYEALAGVRPFVRGTAVATAVAHVQDAPPPLPDRVPPALTAVVERAMAKDPAQRFADGAALARAFRQAAGSPDIRTQRPPLTALKDSGLKDSGLKDSGQADFRQADSPTQVLGEVAETRVLGSVDQQPTHHPASPDQPARSTPTLTPPRRSSWVAPVLGVLVVVALIAGGVLWLTRDRGTLPSEPITTPSTSTTGAPTTSSAAAAVDIDEDLYLGRPVTEVAAELAALGLKVEVREITQTTGQDENPGQVRSINPNGSLTVGDNVTVEYWGARPTPSATPTPTLTPSPTASPTEPPATIAPATPQESATP